MVNDIIHSRCIKKRTLETKINSITIQSHILRILSTSILHDSFIRYQNFEFSMTTSIYA
jgi:hypothetical protein